LGSRDIKGVIRGKTVEEAVKKAKALLRSKS
jgi:hypothetical protein